MTELIERPDVDSAREGSSRYVPPHRRARHVLLRGGAIAIALLLVGGVISTVVAATSGPTKRATPGVKTVSLVSPLYTPKGVFGGTDDYHCTLLNPHVTRDAYVISSQFAAGSAEVHHAVLSLVPPSLAATAMSENASNGGKGWTCFGAPDLPNATILQFFTTAWLSVWAPGHGADVLPKGTGVPLPAGSLVIMQVHYNLLVGDKPVKNSLVLDTVPVSKPLLPLHVDLAMAPPDIPCPTGVTGPLCDRSASLSNQGLRFGSDAVATVGLIEQACGHNPSNPPIGDTASCIWPISKAGYIVRAQAHMHLLGRSFTMVLNPGTPQAKTVLDVPNYDFHYQKAYNMSTPIPVKAGDKLQVNCTFDPTLAQELPILRKAPPHFVTWGDGSTDEMCLGLVWTSASLPNPHSSL
jgi:Copper type II ascorbate-dependent monooxygenase, C-terminal domain